jgi:hypothetical protein
MCAGEATGRPRDRESSLDLTDSLDLVELRDLIKSLNLFDFIESFDLIVYLLVDSHMLSSCADQAI